MVMFLAKQVSLSWLSKLNSVHRNQKYLKYIKSNSSQSWKHFLKVFHERSVIFYALSYREQYLTKWAWAFSIEMRFNKSLSYADDQSKNCLHFQQILSIEAWPLSCLRVRIKAPTGLGYIVTWSMSRGSNSTFNYDVCCPTGGMFFSKKAIEIKNI